MGRDFETRRLTAILKISSSDVRERFAFNEWQVYGECLIALDGVWVEWRFDPRTDAATESEDAEWVLIEIVFSTRDGREEQITLDFTGEELWEAAPDEKAPTEMRRLAARTLYCLEVEDDASWEWLGYTLSPDEKLELRLSLPCEFWPRWWLDTAEQTHGSL